MPTAKGGYYTKAGERVPSVTTILSHCSLGGCDGLIHWAVRLTKEGKDWEEVRDKAADAGTLAHGAFEAWAKGQEPVFDGPADVVKRARKAFEGFLQWAEQTKFKITHTELPLVSEQHRFGGCFDAIMMNGKRYMGDHKTSGSVRSRFLYQIRAYGGLWEENYSDEPIHGYLLLRFDGEHGDFHQHQWGELDKAWEGFLMMRRLYEIEKEMKKRAS